MAKVYYNKKEHLAIHMNIKEATKLNFGFEIPGINNLCVCDTCNKEVGAEEIYYVAALNCILCKECFESYINKHHYTDDNSIEYEVAHFNDIATRLNMQERAVITFAGKIIISNKDKI